MARMIKVTIHHNIDPDASFGLNVRLQAGGRVNADPKDRHPLVKVFEYQVQMPDQLDDHLTQVLLADAWEVFNIGHEQDPPHPIAAAYRARRLRSLSVGDVVTVDGQPWAVASMGFDPISRHDLREVAGAEAEGLIRERYQIPPWSMRQGPAEPLTVTVPLA